jgi:hypothetical protein
MKASVTLEISHHTSTADNKEILLFVYWNNKYLHFGLPAHKLASVVIITTSVQDDKH